MSQSDYVYAVDLDDLRESGRELVNKGGQAIALFYHDGEVRAVDNRCPHMGFPLTEGTVDEGILTCHWHHARFELSCGDTFDPWADDVPTYPVDVRDGPEGDGAGAEVWVRPEPEREGPPEEHWANRLDTGLEENLRLVLAKSVIGLLDADADYTDPFATGLRFGTTYRESGWASGLTIHTALANVRESLPESARRRGLYQGLVEVAGDCAGQPPFFEQPALDVEDPDPARLKAWFRENVEVRDADGAERTLRTAIDHLDEADVADLLFSAATDHRYIDTGHTLDHLNKAFEALDHVGWEHADEVLPTHVANLANAERAEETSSWRQPVDLAGLLDDAFTDLPDTGTPAGQWTEPDDFQDVLRSDDPEAIVDVLLDAVEAGATTTQLADAVRFAAATRVAQFGTSNEFSDWNTVHHTFTYANAVHGATTRTDCWELYRGVFDAAASVYLDRFLNTPPAPIPEGDADADPDAALARLRETFETEGEVNAAGRAVADCLAAGGDPAAVRAELGETLVSEDAGFHTFQAVEAAFRGADQTDDSERETVYLVAAARYLAAHTPTRREREQTYTIAERLHRGEKLHETEH
ncbi:Rieske (2Fe-2S) protein [Halospeciosus flavus]|uniref:Rieske 2Fe-2S domain-containing protein n=1 Tax=Halospeciosus flavus TaxID=3032283 RepID=A0ABD5Z410_9EURY|nr:Rieske (2Fe-2S) protein [Halospeciosus flavus]